MTIIQSNISFYIMLFAFIITGLTFFSKGKRTLGWYLTLLPFIISGFLLTGIFNYESDPLFYRSNYLYIFATVLNCFALFVFGASLGSHSKRIPMWHQDEMMPNHLQTSGIYAFIRHPFYTSYFFYYSAILLSNMSTPIVINCLFAFVMLFRTAQREEKQLLADNELGKQYQEYMQFTGMLFPRFNRASSPLNTAS